MFLSLLSLSFSVKIISFLFFKKKSRKKKQDGGGGGKEEKEKHMLTHIFFSCEKETW